MGPVLRPCELVSCVFLSKGKVRNVFPPFHLQVQNFCGLCLLLKSKVLT